MTVAEPPFALLRAAEKGLQVAADWFLSTEQIAALKPLLDRTPAERLRTVAEQLPPGLRYEHVALYLRCRNVKCRKNAAETRDRDG